MTRTAFIQTCVLLLSAWTALAQTVATNVAILVGPTNDPTTMNIALHAAGGRIVSRSSESNNTQWAANNLNSVNLSSWKSKSTNAAQNVVLSFNKLRTARINSVIIDTALPDPTTAGSRDLPAVVELFGARENKSNTYTFITNAVLRRMSARQMIQFPPTDLKYLKVNFQTNYGGSAMQAAKIEVYEAGTNKTVIGDLRVNLAATSAGGAIVRFSSLQTNIAHLIDGSTNSDGWRTLESTLPTEVVVAFRDDRLALVDKVVLNSQSKSPKESWPKRVSISVSAAHPLDGFEEIGILAMEQSGKDQEFTINKRARFVKLRVLENYGGTNSSLGEFKVIEGQEPEYRSILLKPLRQAGGQGSLAASSRPEPAPATTPSANEVEPNDNTAQALKLVSGKAIGGVISSHTDQDLYSLNVPGPGAEIMTLELEGRPNVRTTVALLDQSGQELRRYDPTRPPTQKARLSWKVEPGKYFIKIYEPPSSIAVIWDASSSMRGREQKLKQAIEAYISQVKPSERLQLVQFSRTTTNFLPNFTSDPTELKNAIRDKFKLSSGTAFYDGMTNAMALLKNVEGNRAIIVMSDGSDSSSKLSYPDFWKQIEAERIRIYAIGLGGNLNDFSTKTGASARRTLKHISMATDGWEYFTEDPEELRALYGIVAEDLRTEASYTFTPRFGGGRGTLKVSAGNIEKEPPPSSVVELIFDASGSMREKIEGRRKIEIAKEVMLQTIDGLPEDRRVALRLFGHRLQSQKPEAKFDSELVVPAGPLDRRQLKEHINKLQPVGTTPIAYSLSQVANDLATFKGDRAVVLVTDGREEAGGDPEGVLRQLRAQGFELRLIIVGFGLKAQVRQDVQNLAEGYGGHYFDANTTTELRQAIRHAVLEVPLSLPFRVVEAGGLSLGEGTTGRGELSLPEGAYTVVVDAPGQRITVPNVRIGKDAGTKIFVRREGGEYTVQVQGP